MEDMSFFIISEGGDGLGLATRLQAEGHKTSIWIKEGDLASRGENLVTKSERPDFNPVIIADCTGSGSVLDLYRDSGAKTFGGSSFSDKLEVDRKFASSVFREAEIKQPSSKEFSGPGSWLEAKDFISNLEGDDKLVFKPEGKNSGNIPSYVSKDREDMLKALDMYERKFGSSEASFIIQEFVEGIDISTEGWFSKDHFVRPFNHTLERKHFLNDDIGPSGGCTGNVVWACDEPDCLLCRELVKLGDILDKNQYTGPIDINCVITKEGEAYALEFTPRFGYDAFPTLLYGLFDGDFGAFINGSSGGDAPESMSLRSGYAAGVRVSVPPWPSEDFKSKGGLFIKGLDVKDITEGKFYCYEVSRKEDSEELYTSEGVGIIGVAIGYGSSIEEAFDKAYRFIKGIHITDMQYRTDLAEVFKSDLRKISRYLKNTNMSRQLTSLAAD
jgi:phosphoribosylamine---glycine ligase